jgi:hypothetical protein
MIKINSQAQTGLNFQGVARSSNNVIIASQQISLRLSILQGTATGSVEYSETRKVTTNAQGLFAVVIGDADATNTMGSFTTINWKNTPKFLKIEMDANAGNNYTTIGTTQFQYVAYAQFASSVDAENIIGVVPVARGGTGATNLTSLKTTLALDKINNTPDIDKPISTKTQSVLDVKLNAADTSKYTKQTYTDAALLTKFNVADTLKYTKKSYTDSSLITKLNFTDTASMLSNRIGKDTLNLSARINAKANTTDLNTALLLKANASDVNTSLGLKANASEVATSLSSKVDKISGKELSTNDYSNAEKTKLAAISGTNTGDQDLSSYATNTALTLKANTGDVNTALALKANASDVTTILLSKLNKTDTSYLLQKSDTVTLSNRINLKANASDVNTSLLSKLNKIDTSYLLQKADTSNLSNRINLKANTADVNTSLALKANATEVATSLATKVDKISGKELSTNDYSNAEKTKLSAITGTNTGDQDLSSYATNTALAFKASTLDVNTSLGLKANASEVAISLANKVDKVTGKELSTNDYSNAEKTKLAGITGTNSGDQDLSIYATITALALKANASDVTTSLALKENISNKSSAADLGGLSPSDLLFPTQKAVKDYVTANASSGGVADGGITTIKLADGAVTDAKLATGINKSKVGLGNVENTALSTWAGTNNLTTVGTITSGTWSGTAIPLNNGGTGATNAEAARANLGLVIGTNVQAPLVAGTDYQIPLTAGTSYIVPNSSITAKTKIKITYDTKGLITAGSDATTADIAPSTDRNYVTDIQAGVISNTSGINTGDETTSSIKSKLGIITLSGSNTGDQDLSSYATNTSLSLKENASNKSSAADLGGASPSDILFPTQKAVKDYVTANTNSGGVADGSISTIKLADLAVTDAKLGTGISKSKVGLGNVENVSISTWAGTNSLTTVGTINSGTWSGTAIALSNGGTGATNATAARANLGLVIGANVQAPLIAGTDYQIPLTAGTNYIVPNSSIAGATKTKITYDTKGLITAGVDATTADIAPSSNRNYVTDAQAGVISNTSGINTGDETTSSIKSKLGITTLSGSNTGDQVLPTLVSLGAVPTSRVITINGTGLDLSSDRSYTINTGLTLTDLESSNVKAQTFQLTQPTAINSTTTTTLDLSTGNLLELVLTGPTTLAFSNPQIGTYIIKVKQDGTGGRTLTFPSMKWSDAAVPTITTAANAIDLITLIYDGTHYYGSCLQNF